jgi:hypothetical protein
MASIADHAAALGDEPAAQIGFQDRWRLQAPVR